jgi:hypothetical protein
VVGDQRCVTLPIRGIGFKELSAPTTDKGKVHRGLKRLGNFISSVASKSVADVVAQLAVAWAKANGMIP